MASSSRQIPSTSNDLTETDFRLIEYSTALDNFSQYVGLDSEESNIDDVRSQNFLALINAFHTGNNTGKPDYSGLSSFDEVGSQLREVYQLAKTTGDEDVANSVRLVYEWAGKLKTHDEAQTGKRSSGRKRTSRRNTSQAQTERVGAEGATEWTEVSSQIPTDDTVIQDEQSVRRKGKGKHVSWA
ncbi:hypothetical protein M231_00891 [Tremella mesenterica]|uniref:Uncharacterized protein n=2 Tax=Tremella mesenterica TaxID=5217 RepID=A0A4Q1BV44_TREME|nr:hypothetical protein M231_00891 [Tremella mesenterica]